MAGFFFAFSACVMNALANLPPAQGIAAMQSINVVVLNRWFLAVFFGTAAACVLLAVCSLLMWQKPDAIYRLIGSALYLVGTILVTIIFNVPRNDELASVDPATANGASLWAGLLHKLDGMEPRADGRGPCRRGITHDCILFATRRVSGWLFKKTRKCEARRQTGRDRQVWSSERRRALRSLSVFFRLSSSSHFTGATSPLVLHHLVPVHIPNILVPSESQMRTALYGTGLTSSYCIPGYSSFGGCAEVRAESRFP